MGARGEPSGSHVRRRRYWPTSVTQAAGVIGDPIRHSLSPVLHNAAFAALDLDWVFLAFPVARGDTSQAMAGVRSLGLSGLSVTMPHKAAVAELVDGRSPVVERLGAANAVVRRGRELEGHSTDGDGFLDSLRTDASFDPAGATAVVFGAGGAARAVVLALSGAGAKQVTVVARRAERADSAARLAGRAGRAGAATAAGDADLVVNATPVGMDGGPAGVVLDASLLGPDQLVADLVYQPTVTPLLGEAAKRGARTLGGIGMLVHQAARAFSLWTGVDPPVAVMRRAALRALAGEGQQDAPAGQRSAKTGPARA
jgi:shikimate dehydrogenase